MPLLSVMVAPETAMDNDPGVMPVPQYSITSGLMAARVVVKETVVVLPAISAGESPPGFTSASAVSVVDVGMIGIYRSSTMTVKSPVVTFAVIGAMP